ncbi:erythromycin esterase family protein [Shewanella abyssi]|uniref:erythromycin esterase family protein n=1 Tax=Shewanella abyssi TaxID=311789 RepID=UPI00200D059F|nr:erythromycin esterase family protein [Shewanella abyssi]MCL1049936.1 erythromycin esterase family protein [Shewanella abyssi]
MLGSINRDIILEKICLALVGIIFSCNIGVVLASQQPVNGNLDTLVSDVCNKKVVLLGEDANHGSGKTIETKTLLIKRLIEECGFSAVFFESPVYDFLHFEHAVSINTATEMQLAQSIGGLWSRTKSIAPLIPYLYNKSVKGQVKLAGIDSQTGANQPFLQNELPKRFSGYLQGDRQQACESELYRYLNWQYDDTHLYNDETLRRIAECATEAKTKVDQMVTATSVTVEDKFMLDNFTKYLAFPAGDYFNLRDQAMAENIAWHLSKLPADTKVIVWCATIHAARTLAPSSRISMGSYVHQSIKGEVASIGFSALTGSYGRSQSQSKTIEAAELETLAFVDSAKDIAYFDKESLDRLGQISAHPISYNKPATKNWSLVLDGLVVLRQEYPLKSNEH